MEDENKSSGKAMSFLERMKQRSQAHCLGTFEISKVPCLL